MRIADQERSLTPVPGTASSAGPLEKQVSGKMVGQSERCELTAGDDRLGLTVTSVEGSNVDDVPMP